MTKRDLLMSVLVTLFFASVLPPAFGHGRMSQESICHGPHGNLGSAAMGARPHCHKKNGEVYVAIHNDRMIVVSNNGSISIMATIKQWLEKWSVAITTVMSFLTVVATISIAIVTFRNRNITAKITEATTFLLTEKGNKITTEDGKPLKL